MLLRRSAIAVTLAVCLTAALAVQITNTVTAAEALRSQPSKEVQALWVTRATLASPAAVAQMVRAAQRGGFNTLLVQVRARGEHQHALAVRL